MYVCRDTRNPKEPLYRHSSTHSDDITHLSLLPTTSTFLPPSTSNPLPNRLLFSASTDGLVALSNVQESDEDEAVVAEENWGQSVAGAGSYRRKGGKEMGIWARSDMDGLACWQVGIGEEGEIEVSHRKSCPCDHADDSLATKPDRAPHGGCQVPKVHYAGGRSICITYSRSRVLRKARANQFRLPDRRGAVVGSERARRADDSSGKQRVSLVLGHLLASRSDNC